MTTSQQMDLTDFGLKLLTAIQRFEEVDDLPDLRNKLNDMTTELLAFQNLVKYANRAKTEQWIDEIAGIKTFLTKGKHPSQLLGTPEYFERLCRAMEYQAKETIVTFEQEKMRPENREKLQNISVKLNEIDALMRGVLQKEPEHGKKINDTLISAKNSLNRLNALQTKLEFQKQFATFAMGDIVILTKFIDSYLPDGTVKDVVKDKLQELYRLADMEEIKVEPYKTKFNAHVHDPVILAPARADISGVVHKNTVIKLEDRGFNYNKGERVIKAKVIVAL